MSARDDIQPLLADVKAGLEDLYGDRLDRVILYGSYARGDVHEESDVDLLVVLDGPVDSSREIRRMGDVCFTIGLDHERLISSHPVSKEAFENADLDWLVNVRREGEPV